MTPEETLRMNELCKRIQVEKDPSTFDALVYELNELLAGKERRIHDDWNKDPFAPKTLTKRDRTYHSENRGEVGRKRSLNSKGAKTQRCDARC